MSHISRNIDRTEAARLLQAARAAAPGSADAAEAIDWSFAAMPESRAARRLKIHQLLQQGDIHAADALITQGQTARPEDPALTLLRAQRLHDDGESAAASCQLRGALTRRPQHGVTLALAGRVEHKLGNFSAASRLLRRAMANTRGRRRSEVARDLFLALLDGSALADAQAVLDEMPSPPPDLTAMLLCKQRRPREAAEVLTSALAAADVSAQRDALLCQLIDVLEEIGDTRELASLLETITIDQPRALARAGKAWLSQGMFRRAIAAMRMLSRFRSHRREALTILVAAAALADRSRLAHRALKQQHATSEGVDVPAMADAWRRGLLGRIVQEQQQSGIAGVDPSSSQLPVYLDHAVRVFEADLAVDHAITGAQKAELRRLRSICLAAMGDGSHSWDRMPRTPAWDGREAPISRQAA